jgi:hypothetical protein
MEIPLIIEKLGFRIRNTTQLRNWESKLKYFFNDGGNASPLYITVVSTINVVVIATIGLIYQGLGYPSKSDPKHLQYDTICLLSAKDDVEHDRLQGLNLW